MSPVSAPRDATEHPAGVDGEPQGEPVGRVDIVVPTIGRPSLGRLLDSLAASVGPLPGSVVLVDDRPPGSGTRGSSGPETGGRKETSTTETGSGQTLEGR